MRRDGPDAQDVIIFFTDGEANYGPWYYGNNSAYRKQPCHSAISSANSFKSRAFKPTWIYTIGYDTDQNVRCMGYKSTGTQNGQNCSVGQSKQFPCDEQPIITAYSTLQQMASTIDGQLKFYYQPTNGELTTIFQRVALDLTMVRLVDDNTP